MEEGLMDQCFVDKGGACRQCKDHFGGFRVSFRRGREETVENACVRVKCWAHRGSWVKPSVAQSPKYCRRRKQREQRRKGIDEN